MPRIPVTDKTCPLCASVSALDTAVLGGVSWDTYPDIETEYQ